MTSNFPAPPFVAPPSVMHLPPMGGSFVLQPPYVHGRAWVSPVAPEIPSIDEFLDDVPAIEQFAPAAAAIPPNEAEWPSWGAQPPPAPVSDEWTRDELQGFDWGSAGRLGSAPPDAAAQAWATTEWDEPGGSRQVRQSAAEALARALDQIARRIRAGELRVPGPETVKDDAAVAATLAALLGVRR